MFDHDTANGRTWSDNGTQTSINHGIGKISGVPVHDRCSSPWLTGVLQQALWTVSMPMLELPLSASRQRRARHNGKADRATDQIRTGHRPGNLADMKFGDRALTSSHILFSTLSSPLIPTLFSAHRKASIQSTKITHHQDQRYRTMSDVRSPRFSASSHRAQLSSAE